MESKELVLQLKQPAGAETVGDGDKHAVEEARAFQQGLHGDQREFRRVVLLGEVAQDCVFYPGIFCTSPAFNSLVPARIFCGFALNTN